MSEIKIRDRMSCEESAIFSTNLAFIAHLGKEIHTTNLVFLQETRGSSGIPAGFQQVSKVHFDLLNKFNERFGECSEFFLHQKTQYSLHICIK